MRTVKLQDGLYEFDLNDAGEIIGARRQGEHYTAGMQLNYVDAFLRALHELDRVQNPPPPIFRPDTPLLQWNVVLVSHGVVLQDSRETAFDFENAIKSAVRRLVAACPGEVISEITRVSVRQITRVSETLPVMSPGAFDMQDSDIHAFVSRLGEAQKVDLLMSLLGSLQLRNFDDEMTDAMHADLMEKRVRRMYSDDLRTLAQNAASVVQTALDNIRVE